MLPVPDPYDLANYDYALPPELIAHEPAQPRDHSRLLYLRSDQTLHHKRFFEIVDLLRPDDVLVINETRVIKARIYGKRLPHGGAVELLVLGVAPEDPQSLLVLAKPAKRLKPGMALQIGPWELEIINASRLRLPADVTIETLLQHSGEIPLPPYITPPAHLDVEVAYQPVFARVDGSIAAPTASLHFTHELLAKIKAIGIDIHTVTLNVGLGTFAPVRGESLRGHIMHTEEYEVPLATAMAINEAKQQGRRIVAIGTTVVRTLESSLDHDGKVVAQSAETQLCIMPGYTFKIVDALLTNFHVPRSTLLALVSAFAGRERILHAYAAAISARYRFFSFGDAMLLEAIP